jgi:hypothetical protein
MPVRQFTAWSAVQSNSRVDVNGMSRSANANFTIQPNGDVVITSLAPSSAVDTGSTSMRLTYGSNRSLTGVDLRAPGVSESWENGLRGDTVGCGAGACEASDAAGTSVYTGVDPFSVNFEYQTFGIWAIGGMTSGNVGAISIGAPTPVNAIPTVGSATYTGGSAGYYADAAGNVFASSAAMTSNVDFGARTVGFSTSGTAIANVATPPTAAPGLDISGNLTYQAGGNQFTGPVTSANAVLSGTADGRFYGPNAEEIGGVYSLRSGGPLESMLGSFGGRR